MILNEQQLQQLDAALAAAHEAARQSGTPKPLRLPGDWAIVDTQAESNQLASAIELRAKESGIRVESGGTSGSYPPGAVSPEFYVRP